MPYAHAKELLKKPEATSAELARALFDLGKEWGYIAYSAGHGLRVDAEPDLIRILVLSDVIIRRIEELQK